ncbi:MAG: ribosome-associated translation inhibitor RaiA [Anaerolineae bacterium]|jgi:putative sigma-54 modulation protein|nr:ribosome-associated translation inhibitor RaiA [Anaerolineae bacterium]
MKPEVTIYTRNMNLRETTEEYVNKKVGKFIRHLPIIDEIRVDLSHDKNAREANDRNSAQITIMGKKLLLRVEERSSDLLAAIDLAVAKMDRQIHRYKGKNWNKKQHGGSVLPDEFIDLPDFDADEEEEEPEIVRRKKFSLYPMDELEALEQMKMLGHENFFIFYNANTSNVNVLYKRRDGTFGLIEPEVG